MSLFRLGLFRLHSGSVSHWKVDCEGLTDADWRALAVMAYEHLPPYGRVEGVPRGGAPFALALEAYASCHCGHTRAAHCGHAWDGRGGEPDHCSQDCPCGHFRPVPRLLLADDVCTTGASLEGHRAGREALGVAAFARGPVPPWVVPLFRSPNVRWSPGSAPSAAASSSP